MRLDNYYEEHTIDPQNPYYRECKNCEYAFRKTETALMNYRGDFYCDPKCIKEREEGLRAAFDERRFQESRDGGY